MWSRSKKREIKTIETHRVLRLENILEKIHLEGGGGEVRKATLKWAVRK
jgi:hypothetical protein